VTENAKKGWKLAFIVVPVIVANIGSYMKARAESKDESKASYEALSKAFTELEKETDNDHQHLAVLEGRVAMLADLLEKANARTALIHPGVKPLTMKQPADAGTDGDGIPDRPAPFVIRKSKADALPASFEDVVQRYKAKK
jgi:hypothetical protein